MGSDDPVTKLEELQAALENIRSALTSGDLAHLLAAQERAAAVSLPTGSTLQFRQALRASVVRAREILSHCQATNAALLMVVEQCRTALEGPPHYTRSGGLGDRPADGPSDASLSCRA